MKKRTTTLVSGLAAALVFTTLFSTAVQAHQKPTTSQAAPEWQQRPIEQPQANPKDQVEFARLKTECLQTAAISFGPEGRWAGCRIVSSAFVATIGLQDFFYSEYCLITAGDACAKQAQVLFRNRAYRDEAFADMVRIDPAGTRYDSPVLIGSDKENVLTTAALLPGKSVKQRRYFRYAEERWMPIDGQAWLQQLRTQLPKGVSVRVQPQNALPDPQTMMLSLPLYRATDRNCCARGGSVDVQLAITDGQLVLADFDVKQGAK